MSEEVGDPEVTPEIPPFLKRFNTVDFRDEERSPYEQLIAAIRGAR